MTCKCVIADTYIIPILEMALSLRQDKSERTIGYVQDEKYVAVVMFNFSIISIITCESDAGRDAFRAYRVQIRPLHVETGAKQEQEVILNCEDIFQ